MPTFSRSASPTFPVLFAAGLLALVISVPSPVAAQERYALSGDRVAVYNVAGEVQVVAGTGNDVIVEVMRGGSDAQGIVTGVRQVDGRQALVLRYPDDTIVYPAWGGRGSSSFRIREDGTFFGGRRGGDRVQVRGSGSGMEAWADLRITVPAGRDLALYLAVGEADVDGLQGNVLLDMGAGAATVARVRGRVEVDTGSGDVGVEQVDGEVVVDTGSGDVRVRRIQGPALTVDTGSGEVTGGGVSSPSVRIDTGSGDISLDGVDGAEVIADTGSGDVRLALLGNPENVRVDTGSGDVELRILRSVDAEIVVDTGSGRIETDLDLQSRTQRRDFLRGRLGSGSGRIFVDTGSGNVSIRGG